jgi:GT2 family glycosyltransferase/glycosyltransferase involved in cell wall biosynthesis
LIILLARLKNKLRNNLSVSSKLTLRSLFAGAERSLRFTSGTARKFVTSVGDIAAGKGMRLPAILRSRVYDLAEPVPPAVDFSVPARTLSTAPLQSQPGNAAIKTSIIIAVFNKAAFTFQCLQSLLREVDLDHREIIIVDNASSDDTAQLLSQFSDLIYVISNEENRGFVDACNQGAAAARGEFLVFLNNDTEVSPGWLTQLEETAEQKLTVGAVGSMFLYPDGSIQEAGAIVWKNGDAHHYGWGGSPDDRRFNFAREVDYCSAASLLIRKELFDKLGGFDRRFAPAYYEDVDLCFSVRSLGYKVMYQPASRLVHYEGATAGRDVKQGIKHFQITNRERFVEKWRAVLDREHLEKNLKHVPEAAHRLTGPTILVFDERVPSPDRDAGSARMWMILKTLAQWSHVVFMPFNHAQEARYEAALWKAGIETAQTIDYRLLLKSSKVKAAIVSRPLLAEALIPRIRRANHDVTIVFDMVDAHFIRLERESKVSGDPQLAREAQQYQKLEVRLAQMSDLIWCNSSEDKRVMQHAAPGKRIEVLPTIHELHDRGKPFAERADVLFVGNLAHRPNSDGIHFLMKEIFPLIQKSLPRIKLYIVGDNASPEILAYASNHVRVNGYVVDIAPLFEGCRVFVAPVRFGAGVKGKIGEAMSYGLPVVTTSIGAEGFGLTNEVNIMIADDPADFAAAVSRLYSEKELWQTLADNSHLHIDENFTPEVIAPTINNSIREVSGIER